MPLSSFGEALTRLWPNGDEKILGLRAGMIETAGPVFQKYGINTPLLIVHVMAQISHECAAGHEVVENLNYTASRMMQVWPSRFPTMASAEPFAGNPKALANNVYDGRMGNVTGSDDGWNFRGRGASQTTGREGYGLLARATKLDLLNNPELVNDPKNFLECGVADFIICGCLPYAIADDIIGVTRKLNGGYVGLSERKVWLSKWKAANVSVTPGPIVILPTTPNPAPPDIPSITAGDTKPAPTDLREPDNEPTRGPEPPAPSFASVMSTVFSIFKPKGI